MAEFVEVCRQALRMAVTQKRGKDIKDVAVEFFVSEDGRVINGISTSTAEEIEKAIMKWAAKHPEPKYPTWNEWQKANFPNAEGNMCPTAFGAMSKIECNDFELSCEECMNCRIPADIAAKLGVKAIEGSENK